MIHVVAGVLRDGAGRVLLAQRPPGAHLAGGWEFPGGKLEPGETRIAGLSRELGEELGVGVDAARPLMRISHRYEDRDILLDCWLVTAWRGEPRGLDGQQLRWCPPEALPGAGLLPADAPLVCALALPERIAVAAQPCLRVEAAGVTWTGACCDGPADAQEAVRRGAQFIAMRRRLASPDLGELCARVAVPVYAHGITLEAAWDLGAIGVAGPAG